MGKCMVFDITPTVQKGILGMNIVQKPGRRKKLVQRNEQCSFGGSGPWTYPVDQHPVQGCQVGFARLAGATASIESSPAVVAHVVAHFKVFSWCAGALVCWCGVCTPCVSSRCNINKNILSQTAHSPLKKRSLHLHSTKNWDGLTGPFNDAVGIPSLVAVPLPRIDPPRRSPRR